MTEDRPEGPLGRWSRLKRTRTAVRESTRRGAAVPVVHKAGDENKALVPVARDETSPSSALEQPRQPEDLPDIGSLGKDSDFTAFLREGVPEELRRQALRVLWRSDPVLANLDGLNDYDEDFKAAHKVAEAIRTAYRVGKGYLDQGDEKAATEEPAVISAAEPSEQTVASEADGTSGETAVEEVDATASPATRVGSPDRDGGNT